MNKDFIVSNALLPPGTRVLCAVSGGNDSMCMLHFLKKLEKELDITVCAAHFEHGIRGEESLRDCAFVESYCRENNIECLSAHENVPDYAALHGMGIEEAARKLRYGFLQSAAEELRCGVIATAHNADDNAETVLFNLVRGTGAKGLAGIPVRRGNIVRPILNVSREEIERYNAENGVPHVEDSTNSADDYSRNVIRHSVVPVLKSINPAFSAHALTAARLLREDDEALDELARKIIAAEFDGESVPAAVLRDCPKAVSSRVIRKLWGRSLQQKHVEAVLSLLEGDGIACADVPGGRIRREQGRIYFKETEAAMIADTVIEAGKIYEPEGLGLRISVKIEPYPEEINNSFKTYRLKNENICGTLHVSSRAEGDRIALAGRGCTKSLKSLFTEAKMTQKQREQTPVFRDERGVAAVYGFGIDRRFIARPGDTVLRIDIEKI